MGLPALDELKKCIVGVLRFFFPELGRGNKMLMSSQKSVRYSCYHGIFRGDEVASHFPQFVAVTQFSLYKFPLSNNFQVKNEEKSLSFYFLQFLFFHFYFRHFVIATLHPGGGTDLERGYGDVPGS